MSKSTVPWWTSEGATPLSLVMVGCKHKQPHAAATVSPSPCSPAYCLFNLYCATGLSGFLALLCVLCCVTNRQTTWAMLMTERSTSPLPLAAEAMHVQQVQLDALLPLKLPTPSSCGTPLTLNPLAMDRTSRPRQGWPRRSFELGLAGDCPSPEPGCRCPEHTRGPADGQGPCACRSEARNWQIRSVKVEGPMVHHCLRLTF